MAASVSSSSSIVRLLSSNINPGLSDRSVQKRSLGFPSRRSLPQLAMLKRLELSASAMAEGVADCLDESTAELGFKRREPGISTILTSCDNSFDPYGAMSTPLYQTATFKQPSATGYGPYDYTRSGNPTRDVLQSLMAELEKADQAFCFTSGMAALAAVTHLLETGQEIVAGSDIYGGSDRLLSQVVPKQGVLVKRVDTTDLNEVASAIGPWTKLVWLESPTNPRQQITDIKKISEMAHSHGAIVLVDNSIMSPVLSHPLELGADIVMHSATKFIAGHSDVMAGILAVKGERLKKILLFYILLSVSLTSSLAHFILAFSSYIFVSFYLLLSSIYCYQYVLLAIFQETIVFLLLLMQAKRGYLECSKMFFKVSYSAT